MFLYCFRFYQHLRTGCRWNWGLCWSHTVSTDLVRWRRQPVALAPTPGKVAECNNRQ